MLKHRQGGFTLAELAVVFFIVALLIGGAFTTLSVQVEQRNSDETLRRLNAAADAVIAYAIVNRRLPCPARYTSATSHSQALESFCVAATGTCAGSETTTLPLPTHGNCSNFYNGFLPAASIGATSTDGIGFAVDSWGNRLRYVVARDVDISGCTTAPPSNTRVFTSQLNLKTYGLGCRPNDLDVCADASCTTRAVSAQTVAFIVYSTGKNGAITTAYGTDEAENTDGDARFVSRTPNNSAPPAYYDDLMLFVPAGVLYSKLISAAVLP